MIQFPGPWLHSDAGAELQRKHGTLVFLARVRPVRTFPVGHGFALLVTLDGHDLHVSEHPSMQAAEREAERVIRRAARLREVEP
jgi:hypothetical protein